MKKALMVAVLIGVGLVSTSHAVVMSWAALVDVDGTGKVLTGLTSAQLYYVESGTWAENSGFSGTEAVGTLVTGRPVSTSGGMGRVSEQATTDSTTRSQGAYFVVAFDSVGKAWRSNASIGWNEAAYVTSDPMNPAGGLFIGGTTGGTEWGVVPEPNTFALLALGAAALAARRRKRT